MDESSSERVDQFTSLSCATLDAATLLWQALIKKNYIEFQKYII